MLSTSEVRLLNSKQSYFKFRRLACNNRMYSENEKLYVSIKDCIKYHSKQNVKALSTFYPFELYSVPILHKNEDISLNLTLNAIFQVDTWIFQMRQPVNTIQRFESSRIVQNDNVQIAYGLLLDGFIREMQNEIVQIIPLVIALIIKLYNRVGAADFFCEKFQNPTFDLFIMRWENNPTPCDEMIDMDL